VSPQTPFDDWYSRHIAPTLPRDAPPKVLKLSREMMAACWNGAIDEAVKIPERYREEIDARNACNGIILNQKLLYTKNS
jgi:hypothetical protein